MLETRLQTLTSSQSVFLEKYGKRHKNFKNQIIFTKIVYALIFSVFPLIPLITYFQVSQEFIEPSFRFTSNLFIESLLFGLFFGLQLIYFISLRLLNFGVLLSGNTFRFLETLPIPQKKLNRLSFLTIFRSVDLPILAMILTFPILIFIKMKAFEIVIICVSFGISFLNVLFQPGSRGLVSCGCGAGKSHQQYNRFWRRRQEQDANLRKLLIGLQYAI